MNIDYSVTYPATGGSKECPISPNKSLTFDYPFASPCSLPLAFHQFLNNVLDFLGAASKQNQRGELYVDGIKVKSGQSGGDQIYINSLKRLFLGGVPKNFYARRVPVSRFAASLFDARCRSVEPITGGY